MEEKREEEKPKEKKEKRTGFEVAMELEKRKPTIKERLIPELRQIKGALGGVAALTVVFFIGIWLAGNPFEATARTESKPILDMGLTGDKWAIIWSVFLIAFILEFMDAAAGMGYGTAITPLLLVMGFTPLQIVPCVMIQQATCGLIGVFLHQEFENVEWKFKPMSDTIKLWLITASVGCIGVMTSIIGVYVILGLDKFWISMYVVVLLFVMAFCALFQATFIKVRPYRPWWMLGFGAVAGFNKGIGGGGYGPVVTVGGLIAGIPPKSMLGITALNEGTVSGFATIVWAATLTLGVKIDYILLPTMMLASIGSAVAAPYMVRVFPTKFWTWIIPAYCAVVAAIVLYRLWPEIMKKMAGG